MIERKCPHCGSTKLWSYGHQWQCANCKRRWTKNPRTRGRKKKNEDLTPKMKRCSGCDKFVNISEAIPHKFHKSIRYLCKECQEKVDRGEVSLSLLLGTKKYCHLCGKRILKLENLKIIELKDIEAKELFLKQRRRANLTLYWHEECYKKLPLKVRRIVEGKNFTHRCLDIQREIWIELDEEGHMKGQLFSDIPEEDKKLREIREETGITFVEYLKKGGSIIA